jgi:hypothetical protein
MSTTPRRDLETWIAKWTEVERLEFVRESDSNSKRFWEGVRSSPISPYLSPWERQFATTTELTMSNQQQLDGSWRLEAVQVLLWALRLMPELPPPDTQADLHLSELEMLNDATSFLNSAVLRSQIEIYHARDVAALALAQPHRKVYPRRATTSFRRGDDQAGTEIIPGHCAPRGERRT